MKELDIGEYLKRKGKYSLFVNLEDMKELMSVFKKCIEDGNTFIEIPLKEFMKNDEDKHTEFLIKYEFYKSNICIHEMEG